MKAVSHHLLAAGWRQSAVRSGFNVFQVSLGDQLWWDNLLMGCFHCLLFEIVQFNPHNWHVIMFVLHVVWNAFNTDVSCDIRTLCTILEAYVICYCHFSSRHLFINFFKLNAWIHSNNSQKGWSSSPSFEQNQTCPVFTEI